MRALVLNGSPTSDRGATYGVLQIFLRGMEKSGVEIDLVHLAKMKIDHCKGCFTCWTKTPGTCIQRDDMDELLPKVDGADFIIFATPVYVDGMTGLMKNAIDRSIPLDSGKVILKDNHCRHPRRSGEKSAKVALVSVCGFAEMDNFDPLVHHIKAICKNMGNEYVGAILRPYAWALGNADRIGIDTDDIIEALEEAGKQLVIDGKFDATTLRVIEKQLLSTEIVATIISSQFE